MDRSRQSVDPLLSRLAGWTALAAATELIVLRISTRTFIHIPGLDVLTGPLSVVSELGRLAFYLTLVLLLALSVRLIIFRGRDSQFHSVLPIGALALVLVGSALATAGLASPHFAGWTGLGAAGLAAAGVLNEGRSAIPVILWSLALAMTASPVLLQHAGGLAGGEMAVLARGGELLAVIALLSLPLLLEVRLSRTGALWGIAIAVFITAAFWASPSTSTILALWSVGVPGSLPALAYGAGAASATITIWTAWQSERPLLAAAVTLLLTGGFGLISTYQTTLVVVGLVLAGTGIRSLDELAFGASESANGKQTLTIGR